MRNEKKKQAKIEKNLPNVLQYTFKNALKIYLGKPKIDNFDNYNADDEVFITKIGSDKFSIPVEIQIKAEEAQKLDKKKQFKNLKPEITFEYTDGNLYVSNVLVKLKKKTYAVTIGNLSQYNPEFKLKSSVKDTFVVWKDEKIKVKGKLLISYLQKKEKIAFKKHEIIRIAKEKFEARKKLRKLGVVKRGDGLMWQDNKAAKEIRLNWYDAKKYCQNLNLAHKKDWRLPNKKELFSIVNENRTPSIKIDFTNVTYGRYWSDSSSSNSKYRATYIYFYNGDSSINPKEDENYVRCVRGKK